VEFVAAFALSIERGDRWHSGDARRRPQEYLGSAELAHDQGFDEGRTHFKPPREVEAKAQGVEEGATAQDALVVGKAPGEVRQGIGRIGDDQDDRLRRHGDDAGYDVAIDLGVCVKQLEPAGRIAAVGRAAGPFVDASGDDRQHGACEVGIVTSAQLNRR
jgi:hypothetical protein